MQTRSTLSIGDRIEIRYRESVAHQANGIERDKWLAAEIRYVEPCSWPLARLCDGRFTEVRPFMDWRFAKTST